MINTNRIALIFHRERRRLRSSEVALIALAVLVGVVVGLLTLIQGGLAHGLQRLFYGSDVAQLSALDSIEPFRLLALPFGGLLIAGIALWAKRHRQSAPIDVVEANALHGGHIPARDSLLVSAQTIVSNGCGASVGLEAAYAQMGGGAASVAGSRLKLRRNDLRTMVGAGAGAAVGAAFGAPLTGAFYAFEIVIGAYTPAAIAPVAAACIAATLTIRAAGGAPYQISLPSAHAIVTVDYLLYAALGFACALVAVSLMQAVTSIENAARRLPIADFWRPVVGGALLIPIGLVTPQALSAGHGALHLDLSVPVGLGFLVGVFLLKLFASSITLGFGFRGGLFFASLFLGSLAGQIFALALSALPGAPQVDPVDAALVGMAAMAVSVVGGPMTMSMLVLESTHDFALASVALAAVLCASTLVREAFGFSFSTWRLHVRGETIRSARDVGWVRNLTAGRMMRCGVPTAGADISVAELRRRHPLGSTGRVVLTDDSGRYAGIVPTALAFAATTDPDARAGDIAIQREVALRPEQDVAAAMQAFEEWGADDLAVVDEEGRLLGLLSEKHVRRRYAEELEKAQRELFGES
jgi:CIC family chloride channel protein